MMIEILAFVATHWWQNQPRFGLTAWLALRISSLLEIGNCCNYHKITVITWSSIQEKRMHLSSPVRREVIQSKLKDGTIYMRCFHPNQVTFPRRIINSWKLWKKTRNCTQRETFKEPGRVVLQTSDFACLISLVANPRWVSPGYAIECSSKG